MAATLGPWDMSWDRWDMLGLRFELVFIMKMYWLPGHVWNDLDLTYRNDLDDVFGGDKYLDIAEESKSH